MSLADINEELHRRSRDTTEPLPDQPVPVVHPKSVLPEPKAVPAPQVPVGEAWSAVVESDKSIDPVSILNGVLKRLPRKFVILVGVLALALIAIGVIFKAGGWLFDPGQVQVSLSGPKLTESNEIVEYVIQYENNNWVDLEEAELIITYPEIFRPVSTEGLQASASRATLSLGTVKKSSVNTIALKGSFHSLQDQVALITVTLRAAPKGVTSRIDTEYRYSVAVESSALVAELIAPQQVGDGQFIDYIVNYRNESAEPIDNLELVIEYPIGFEFQEAEPSPSSGENRWKIRTLGAGGAETVTIRGLISGSRGDVKRVFAKVGKPQGDGTLLSYADIERQTRIVTSPLSITQKISTREDEPSVEPGESLNYKIAFKNEGNVGLRDLIVTVDLDPRYFDVQNSGLGGTYSLSKRQAIFRASDQPVLLLLEPGESGEISFSVPVSRALPTYGQSDMEIESIARIDSPDVPTPIGANKIIASSRAVFKVRTTPKVELSGFHFDAYGNTGPVPPVVEQETTYTLNFRVSSSMNAIENGLMAVSLPGQVHYVKTHSIGQGSVVYNDRTGEVFWNIGTVLPGAGRAATLAIQISLRPDITQVGSEVRIVNSARFTGRDTWTGVDLLEDFKEKLATLPEDTQLAAISDRGKVRSTAGTPEAGTGL